MPLRGPLVPLGQWNLHSRQKTYALCVRESPKPCLHWGLRSPGRYVIVLRTLRRPPQLVSFPPGIPE